MRKRFATRLLAILGMVLSGLASLAAEEGPRAVFPVKSHDFGTVRQGDKLVHAFTVRNEGPAPLTIDRADLDVSGLIVRLPRVLPPGGQSRITLEWDTGRVKGETEAEIVVHLDDPAEPRVTLVLKAMVKPPIDILPYAAAFFSVYEGETAERTVQIVNNEESPLRITRVEPDGRHFAATLKTIQPGKIYELVVKVPQNTPAGRYMEAVYLQTDHPTQSRLKVAVNVLVKTDPFVDPPVVDFGQVSLDELTRAPKLLDLLTQKFTIRKRRGEFRIKSIVSDVPFLEIKRMPAGRSALFQIDVGLVRERIQRGDIAGSIRILTSDRKFPKLVVLVRGEVK
jgi:hypothetical protein